MINHLLFGLLLVTPVASDAQQNNVPRLEPSDCIYKADDPGRFV
jgi:hypothetical protein